MNSKNGKHFSRRLNIQVCELLQVLTEAGCFERCFEKYVFYGILKHNKQQLKMYLKFLKNICEEVHF